MDAVDGVVLEVDGDSFRVAGHAATPIPASLKSALGKLLTPGEDAIDHLATADVSVAHLFADTALALLADTGLAAGDITAIGSHGQTVRHCPPSTARTTPYTVQIGDPSTIAATTGIATVADFRRKDIALGGEAAPLVPAFHHAVFSHPKRCRAVINIGGIANITWLPAGDSGDAVTGFDCGPGNCLLDSWIMRHRGEDFDRGGRWAAGGTVDFKLLARLLEEPYLARRAPKSTGRELFNLAWLDQHLGGVDSAPSAPDVQATLCEFTARTIADGIAAIGGSAAEDIFVCGGGAFNDQLMARLADLLPGAPVQTTAAAGIDPLHVEAAAFAWLAHRTLNRQPGNLPAVTGASRPAVLGGIYYP